jgi:hypothetical protein
MGPTWTNSFEKLWMFICRTAYMVCNQHIRYFLIWSQHNRIAGNSRVKWQKLPSLLSANQEPRNQTHPCFSQTLSHTLLYSLTHNTILSHTHFYIILQKQLYSLTHTTIRFPTYYNILSHGLLYSLTYPTICSLTHYYTLSHTLLYSHTRLYTLIHTCKQSIIVWVYEY